MEEEDRRQLHELMLIYDNIADEIEEIESQGGVIEKEPAQRLYNLYEAITDVLGKYNDCYKK